MAAPQAWKTSELHAHTAKILIYHALRQDTSLINDRNPYNPQRHLVCYMLFVDISMERNACQCFQRFIAGFIRMCSFHNGMPILQMKEEQLRLEESEADMRKRLKANREHSKKWEAGREDRVGTWRDFAKGNKSKKVQSFHFYRTR